MRLRSRRMTEKSCGCVVIEDGKVLLIQQRNGHWGFPKGHVEADETERNAAIRETKEETNIEVEIEDGRIYTENYITDKGNYKEVIYYTAKKLGGEVRKQESEIRDVKWFPLNEALDRLTYDNTRNLLKKIIKDKKL
jgi:ADP-ribose pyrophosphatase YjhB (NUDIX family)